MVAGDCQDLALWSEISQEQSVQTSCNGGFQNEFEHRVPKGRGDDATILLELIRQGVRTVTDTIVAAVKV